MRLLQGWSLLLAADLLFYSGVSVTVTAERRSDSDFLCWCAMAARLPCNEVPHLLIR